MMALVALLLAAGAAWVLTGMVRGYALRRALIDIPNHRSSHTDPTPRGGGLAIAVVCIAGFGVMAFGGWVPFGAGVVLAAGGLPIVLIGWLDDQRDVHARWRLLTHFAAAGLAVYILGGLESVAIGTHVLALGPIGSLLAVVGLVWIINLFNFMDGIDGIAGGETMTVATAGGLLFLAAGAPGIGLASLLVAAATAGFLIWNWPPAKIFMGDVGSGLLGFLLGVLALLGEVTATVPLMVWILLLGAFIFDATVTLARRMIRGERWYRAHRSHAYQRAVQAGWTHRRVTTAVLALNVILSALAVAVWLKPAWTVPIMVSATVLLTGVYALVESRFPMRPSDQTVPAGDLTGASRGD